MRAIKIVPGEYYHIYNRSNDKHQDIFLDSRDWNRFLFLILCFQARKVLMPKLERLAVEFVRHRVLDIDRNILNKIINQRDVELIAFALMPNHFHLIVTERKEGGISTYMQRILDGYTKYFNAKYEKTGHLFQGPYQTVHVKDNDQLLYLSAYIHRNPRELKTWRQREHQYPWSSYQDYASVNRWGQLLKPEIILDQFKSGDEYHKFVKTSGAKDLLGEELLLE